MAVAKALTDLDLSNDGTLFFDTMDNQLKIVRFGNIEPTSPPRRQGWSAYEKLAMRLNKHEGDEWGPGMDVHIFEGPNRTFVFVAAGDKALILEDSPALFPSDSMVAQFQLFRESL